MWNVIFLTWNIFCCQNLLIFVSCTLVQVVVKYRAEAHYIFVYCRDNDNSTTPVRTAVFYLRWVSKAVFYLGVGEYSCFLSGVGEYSSFLPGVGEYIVFYLGLVTVFYMGVVVSTVLYYLVVVVQLFTTWGW